MNWRRVRLVALGLTLATVYPWWHGYRLSPGSALRAFPYLPPDHREVTSLSFNWGHAHMLEDREGGHVTALCLRRFGFLWRCEYLVPEPRAAVGDRVRTVGFVSWQGHGEKVTVMVVRNTDPRVATVVAGPAGQRLVQPAPVGTLVVLRWPGALSPQALAAEARDAQGAVLYRYADPESLHQWRWYPETP